MKVAANTGSSGITVGRPFTIIARLENVGYGDADAISADVNCPFSPAKKAFIGQLKKDEDAPAVFELTSQQSGSFKCDLIVNFKDDTGSRQITETFDVTVAGPDYSGLLTLLIIIAAIAFIFRKRIQHLLKRR